MDPGDIARSHGFAVATRLPARAGDAWRLATAAIREESRKTPRFSRLDRPQSPRQGDESRSRPSSRVGSRKLAPRPLDVRGDHDETLVFNTIGRGIGRRSVFAPVVDLREAGRWLGPGGVGDREVFALRASIEKLGGHPGVARNLIQQRRNVGRGLGEGIRCDTVIPRLVRDLRVAMLDDLREFPAWAVLLDETINASTVVFSFARPIRRRFGHDRHRERPFRNPSSRLGHAPRWR